MAMNALRTAAKESKVMKFILGGFIFLAVGGLVFTDINGYFRGGLPNTTVARVGDTEISIVEFDRELRGFLAQTQLTPQQAYEAGLINAYLDSRINDILVTQAAEDLDIQVANDMIAKQIRNVFADASKDEIQMALRARGLSENQMAAMIRQQIRTNIVNKAPGAVGNYVPASLVSAWQRLESEKRSGVMITIPAEKIAESNPVKDDDVAAYYENNKADYMIPEKRVFIVGTMTHDMAAKNLPSISEDDLRAEYEMRMDEFIQNEKRTIEQAVAKNPDDAQAIYEAGSAGAALTKALSDVTGDESGYRAPSEYEYAGLPEQLAKAAFDESVTKGTVLPPVKTLLGWTVMKVMAITPEKQRTFDEVANVIRKEINDSAVFDTLYDKMLETEKLIDEGTPFDVIASRTGLKTETLPALAANIANDDLPESLIAAREVSPSVIDEIFNLSEGDAGYPVETDDNGYVVIGVKKIEPASYTALDKVEKDIRKILSDREMSVAASAKAKDIENSLNDGTQTMDKIAATYGGSKKSFQSVTRDTASYDADLVFGTNIGGYGASADDKGRVVIAHVTSVDIGKAEDNKDVLQELRVKIKSVLSALQNGFYRDRTTVTVNQNLLEQQYNGSDVL